MARLPGLTPHRDDRPNGFRASARSNVRLDERLSRQAQLRPVAQPVEMYSRPPQPEGTSGMQQLADSLQQLNASLGRFGSAYMDNKSRQQKAQQEVESNEARWLATVSEARNWQEAVKADPSLASKSPFFQGIFRGTQAQLTVLQKGSELLSEYYTSDLASSTDPTAVRDWLLERMKPTFDSFETYEERDMAQKDVMKLIERFTGLHEKQASDNIQYQTRQAASATVQAQLEQTTRNQRDPSRRAIRTTDPVAQNLTPIQRAFLNGVSHGESAGKYNVRYTPSGGALFDLNGMHPRIFEPTKDGKVSSAAGRYQFTATTWDSFMGKDVPFTSENQDIGAVKYGEHRYGTDSKGRNLWQALEEDGFTPDIQKRLGGAWEALKKNHAANARVFQDTLARAGETPQGAAALDPEIMEATAEIHDLETRMLAVGIAPKEVNTVVLDAVANAIIANENPDLAQIAMQNRTRPDGSIVPGPGTTVEGRERIRKAIETMNSNIQQRENRVHTNRDRSLRQLQDNANNMVLDTLIDQVVARSEGRRNEDGSHIVVGINPQIARDVAALRFVDEDGTVHRLPPSAIKETLDLEKAVQNFDEREDTTEISLLTIAAHNGELTQADVAQAIRDGKIRSASTARDISQTVRMAANGSPASDPVFRAYSDMLSSSVSEVGLMGQYTNSDAVAVVKNQLLNEYIGWRESLGRTPAPHEVNDFLAERVEKIGKTYNQVQGRKEPETFEQADRLRRALSGEIVPPPARPQVTVQDPGREQQRNPWFWERWFGGGNEEAPVEERRQAIDPTQYAPRPDANWREEPVFESRQALEEEIGKLGTGEPHAIREWIDQLGLKDNDEVVFFLQTQRELLRLMEE